MKSCTLSVTGTHCRSCELLIEKEISNLPGVKSVSASTSDKKVVINYSKNKPKISKLNQLFKENNYVFSPLLARPSKLEERSRVKGGAGGGLNSKANVYQAVFVSIFIILAFYLIQKTGLFSFFNVSTDSSTPAFFIFGLLAGFSTCAALVGGIVLGLSKKGISTVLSFNLGRLIIFTILGAILGYFGSFFRLSITAGAIITILVSVVMIVTALQMLNLKFLSFINFSLPKSITSKIAFSSSAPSFILGGLTFLLPCGFTLTAQSLALASGNWLSGALTMMFFALGTFIPLMIIGVSGAKIQSNPSKAKFFSQVAGILILVFAIYNINSQFNVLGVRAEFTRRGGLADAQTNSVLKMDASASGYSPNSFTIKAGQPVRWEITDRGTSGCTNAVIARSLFAGPINLVPGTTSVKEFTAPTTPGTYRFSCWMGMISGTITVAN